MRLLRSLAGAVALMAASLTTPASALTPPHLPPGSDHHDVSLTGVRFVPEVITIRAGESVTWTHRDSALFHHVGAHDNTWDSHPTCGHPMGICMQGGETYTHYFLEPGRYDYHCRLHIDGKPEHGSHGHADHDHGGHDHGDPPSAGDGMVGTVIVLDH
jgi:plastocyanin